MKTSRSASSKQRDGEELWLTTEFEGSLEDLEGWVQRGAASNQLQPSLAHTIPPSMIQNQSLLPVEQLADVLRLTSDMLA